MRRAALCVAASLLAACTGEPPTVAPGGPSSRGTAAQDVLVANASVVRVVDGDTIVASIDERRETVRLIGIDTPESVKPDSPVECFGQEASAYTASVLPEGTSIRIERDVEARDDYDRLLAYVYRADDGLFVNLDIVRQGYAAVLTFPPNVAHAPEFVGAAREAEADSRGLWSACR
jgi:micrococcal nuclease